jgi:hypothetical protein
MLACVAQRAPRPAAPEYGDATFLSWLVLMMR